MFWQREATAQTPVADCDLSVRAKNICQRLGCDTIGELAQVFAEKGAAFVLARRNCGRKTVIELLDFVDLFRQRFPSYATAPTMNGLPGEVVSSAEAITSAGETPIGSLEALQVPYGFPIEFVKLPVRIRNWCEERGWDNLGEFLRHTGGMSAEELTEVDNIGRKSAAEVAGLFVALQTRDLNALRKYLPVAPGVVPLSFREALHDQVSSLHSREYRMLEMRLLEGATLEATARADGRTRELVRQVQDRFLEKLGRLLSWFSTERIDLWQHWELDEDLAQILAARGVVDSTSLIAAAISRVFGRSEEGQVLEQYYEETFGLWAKELLNDGAGSGETDVRHFAAERGAAHLGCRFLSWLTERFAGALSFDGTHVIRIEAELTAKQRAMLNNGEVQATRWEESYESLKRYHAEHGNADVPNGWRTNRKLASWVSAQRQRRKKNAMPDEQIRLLDDIGFTWQVRERGDWEDRLAEVAAFKLEHGYCNIPVHYPANLRLGRFVNAMRTQKNRGVLSEERIAKLDAIGFVWASARKAEVKVGEESVSEAWKNRFEELNAYKREHGDCDVPSKWDQNEPLANWVSMQRQLRKADKLVAGRVALLEEIGFSWRANDSKRSWDTRYAELVAFKNEHGHCDASTQDPENSSLGVWAANQRVNRKRGKLSPEQERLLSELGFSWQIGAIQKSWQDRYAELLAFRASHGHCDVSTRDDQNSSLGTWVANQRTNRKRGKLSPAQERLLTEIGFSWQVGSAQKDWDEQYKALLAFRDIHGHCEVSTRDPANASLGTWVAAQRTNKRLGKLSNERVRLLDDVSFTWTKRILTL